MIGSVLGGIGLLAGTASNVANNIRQQRNFNQQMQFAKYQYENSKYWNSYQNQVKQMRAAGINPALSFGQGSQSVSAVSQPSAPSTIPLDMNGLNSFANTIASTDANVNKTKAETDVEKLKAIEQDFNNFLLKNFGEKEHQGALNEQGQRIKESVNRALLLAAQGDYNKALIQLAHAQEFAEYAKGGLDDQHRINLAQEYEWYITYMKAAIREMNSQSYKYRMEGESTELDTSMRREARSEIVGTFQQVFRKTKQEAKLTKKQVEMAEHLISLAEKQDDVFYYKMAMDYLVKIGAEAADIFMMKKRLAALTEIGNREYVDESYEDIEKTSDNSVRKHKVRAKRRKR